MLNLLHGSGGGVDRVDIDRVARVYMEFDVSVLIAKAATIPLFVPVGVTRGIIQGIRYGRLTISRVEKSTV